MYVAHAEFCVSVRDGIGLFLHFRKTFQCQLHSAEDCLRLFVHGNVLLTWVLDTHAWMLPLVSDTHACTLLLVSGMQTCVVRSPPNISSKTCHHTLWVALRLNCPCSQAAENFAKKNSKCDVKNLFWPRKIRHVTVVPLAYLRVIVYLFLARYLGKTWQQW